MIDLALSRARCLVADGDDAAARLAYLDALRLDPGHPIALTELGALAHAGGFLSAAREAFRQAVHCHPGYALGREGYGDLLNEAGDAEAACVQYRAALALDSDMPRAHQGLARAMQALGQDAGEHWRKGFVGHAVVRRRYRGVGIGIPLLLLVSAVGGNVPTGHWIDDRGFAVTAIYTDFFDPSDPLPPHSVVVNAIGDADLCPDALAGAERIVARVSAPVINPPDRVRATGRQNVARLMGGLPGVIAPRISPLSQADLHFPLLLRVPGHHTGQHFVRVESGGDLAEAAASFPTGDKLAIEYLDARGRDGMARKYRVMFIDGAAYPLHLAISPNWKVHYFTAAMAADPAHRAEEQRFLDDMKAVLGPIAMAALTQIQAALGLDYAGIDFGLAQDGSLLLFEANATMVINPPDADPMWDYRRLAIAAALAAARRMVARRAAGEP
jgi:hypothetical protein